MNEVFRSILIRADLQDGNLFAAHEVAQWPEGALGWLTRAGILRAAELAEEILCDECPEGCWIKPTIRKVPRTRRRFGTYLCRRNDDVGSFKVDLARRRQWQFSLGGLAKAVSRAVKPTGKVTELAPERLALLGTVKLSGDNRELFLARGAAWSDANDVLGSVVRLKTSPHPAVLTVAGMPLESLMSSLGAAVRPLPEIATFDEKGLHVSIEGAFPSVQPRPWADIPNEPITLDTFMVKYCEAWSKSLRHGRRRALLAAGRNGTVTMPPLAVPRGPGESNRYFVHDLLDAWQGYQDENLDLPPLLPQYAIE